MENYYLKLKLSENIYKVKELENLLLEMSKAVGNPSMIGPHLVNNIRNNSYTIIQLRGKISQLKNELQKKNLEIMKLKGENVELFPKNYYHEGLDSAQNEYEKFKNAINLNEYFKIKPVYNTPKESLIFNDDLKNKVKILENEIKSSEKFNSKVMTSRSNEEMDLLKIENLSLKMQIAKLKSGSEINSPLIYQSIPTKASESINTK